jgi:murein DD-endopeptidase MepM/ murein hydrolase activator NlpD
VKTDIFMIDTRKPRLHFEILKDGEPVDPMEYLP